MILGCNTVLFNQLDLYGALQCISWAGYDGAELAFLEKMARHIELRTDQEYINEVKLIARKHGLKLLAIETSIGSPAESEEKMKIMTKLFEVAKKLDIPIISISSGGRAGDKEVTEEVFKYLRKLGEEAESWEITLAVKPHVGASVYNTETVLHLLSKVDLKSIGINFDPSHLYRAHEDPVEAALKIGDKIVHCHIRDCPHRNSFPGLPEQQIPGRSKIDIPRVLKALKEVGYNGALVLEVIGAFSYPFTKQICIAAEARGYLHRCLQEIKLE